MTIDQLAQRAGTTTRTVRLYQTKGLLPPPTLVARTGYYDESHVQRLTMIERLQQRGFSLASIGELIERAHKGQGVEDLLGLEQAIGASWSEELPRDTTLAELNDRLGVALSRAQLGRAVALGLAEIDGQRVRVLMPSVLDFGVELVRGGVPVDAALDLVAATQDDMRQVVERFSGAIVTHVVPRLLDGDASRLLTSFASFASGWRQTLRQVVLAMFAHEIDRRLSGLGAPLLGGALATLAPHAEPAAPPRRARRRSARRRGQ